MALLEIAHEIGQRLHARLRHRVVDRGAHAAERAVALERDQAGRLRLRRGRACRALRRAGRTARSCASARPARLRCDRSRRSRRSPSYSSADLRALRAREFARRRLRPASTCTVRPSRYQFQVGGVLSIDSPLSVRAVVEDVGARLAGAFEQVAAHDHHADADRAEVLLRAGVDHAELRDVQRLARRCWN